MNQHDYHLSAVRFWQKANQNLKRFSECCYHVEDKDALAADCVCSVRTIQFYAAAWSLYLELQAEFGETVSLLWERGEISLWRKAPQLRNTLSLSLEKPYEYLETAIEHDMTRESFAAHVDAKETPTPQWVRRVRSIFDKLRLLRDDWKTEIPSDLRDEFDAWAERGAELLERISKATVE